MKRKKSGATLGQTVTSLCLMLMSQHEKRYFDKLSSLLKKLLIKKPSPKIAKKPYFATGKIYMVSVTSKENTKEFSL